MRRPTPILGIFLTVLFDMLAFGLVIPDIQLRGDQLGADGMLRGLLLSTYSIAQLLFAPLLGRWSDRIGRRPILLVTTLAGVAGFVVYAHAESLPIMFASRALAGIAGANLGVAFAYIADVTTPDERAKGMGMVGAAFGLGFIMGPPLGAYLVKLGGGHPTLLGYVAAGLALLNFVYIYFLLPESLKPSASSEPAKRAATLRNLVIAFRTPVLGLLLALFFASNLAFTNLESTYFLLTVRHFSMTQEQGAYVLAVVGIVGAIMQGFVVRLVTPRFGELRLLRASYFLQIPALLIIPFAPFWGPQLAAVVLLGIGSGLAQPSMSSLISRNAPPEMQGGIFGVTQALGATARIIGPMVSNPLFDRAFYWPYVVAGTVMLIPLVGAWFVRLPSEREAAAASH